jgi:hypothetical protein
MRLSAGAPAERLAARGTIPFSYLGMPVLGEGMDSLLTESMNAGYKSAYK